MENQVEIAVLLVVLPLALAVTALYFVAAWRVYTRAGQPGWACFVPIYNDYVVLKIGGKPGWWLIWYFIPLVNIIVQIITLTALAKRFGKDVLFGLGLAFLGFIFWPILGFGNAPYRGFACNVGGREVISK